MPEPEEQDPARHLRELAYRGRLEIEMATDPVGVRRAAAAGLAARLLGCAALGLLAAGLSIFAIAILLNLVFHFSPS